jgi:hypothetical protein
MDIRPAVGSSTLERNPLKTTADLMPAWEAAARLAGGSKPSGSGLLLPVRQAQARSTCTVRAMMKIAVIRQGVRIHPHLRLMN